MNVLSLFDGMSCGQIALNRLGVKYDKEAIKNQCIAARMNDNVDKLK